MLLCGPACGSGSEADLPPVMVSRPAAPVPGHAAIPLSPWVSDPLIEEKIIENKLIVWATMTGFSSEVATSTDTWKGNATLYSPVFRFNLSVTSYLKGSGPDDIVAVWIDGHSYGSKESAEERLDEMLALRDDQWDNREAVVFLWDHIVGVRTLLDDVYSRPDHFLLASGYRYSDDDRYSLHSKIYKKFWPEVDNPIAIGDGTLFMTDLPGTNKEISITGIKDKIAAVTAELAAGSGSAYKNCVVDKYRHMRNMQNVPAAQGREYTTWNLHPSVEAGSPEGTFLHDRPAYGYYPGGEKVRNTLTLSGEDAHLFNVAQIGDTPIDEDNDGTNDKFEYQEQVSVNRPLPSGEYTFTMAEAWPGWTVCNYTFDHDWTVTVTPWAGALHEFFFDPVTDGDTVAADVDNGVLRPADFTNADGSSASIVRLESSASTVTLTVQPTNVLKDLALDFIELDGSVSLTLDYSDATVDTASSTLSWSIDSQPWEAGDKLMVRVRK